LNQLLYPPVTENDTTPKPDIQYIMKELSRPHVTMDLLWREYHAQYPDSMSRSSFYRFCQTHNPVVPTMAMVHKAGDKLFVDYSGDGLSYVNQYTGEIIDVELFVSCLGASSYCYVEATISQRAEDFVSSHTRAFSYFNGVPAAIVPDNLKSGVKQSNRFEPIIAPLYLKLTEHYGCVVLPARVRKPKDKAKVENAVLNIQRYMLGRLRNRNFFSLEEINIAIRELLDQFNNEPMKSYGGQSRHDRFLQIDQPALRPLPAERFLITAIQVNLSVARNYHIQYDKHYYSVPYALAQQKVDVHLAGGIVEIYHQGTHVARHKKQPSNYGYSTIDEHMPPNHQFIKGWSPEYFIGKGTLIGHHTTEVIKHIIQRYKHPEQAYKSCLGLLNLDKQYGPERLEAASTRAIYFEAPNYRTVKDILLQGLDQQPLPDTTTPDQAVLPFIHENVRGAEYYK